MYIQSNKDFCKGEELIASLILARTNTIGSITFQNLISKYKSPSRALNQVEKVLSERGKQHYIYSGQNAISEIDQVKQNEADLINIFDEKYPENLRYIDDPPIILTYKGAIDKISKNSVAFVGSRNCSANSTMLSYKLAKEIAESGYSVISGLAKGIDGSAHKGALDASLDSDVDEYIPTVAIIGCGVDHIYPKQHKELHEIIASKGVIISEYKIGTAPKAENFPKRNRIISGLSKVICIIEAAKKSGSLITSRLAIEQNREVMAVPGFPLDPRSEGTNNLIKNGADIITSSKDIIEKLKDIESLSLESSFVQYDSDSNELKFSESEQESDMANDDEEGFNQKMLEDIISQISYQPTSVEYISDILNLNIGQVNSLLIEHEISGEIIRYPGNKVSKAA